MDRNLNRRVETMCPILDAGLRRYLREAVLDAYLKDTGNTWFLDADGEYVKAPASSTVFIAQDYLLDQPPPAGAFDAIESSEVATPDAAATAEGNAHPPSYRS